ncbi:MAG: hypothetical protein AAGJ78_06010 [Pseudomonadota bacterium]
METVKYPASKHIGLPSVIRFLEHELRGIESLPPDKLPSIIR